MHKLVIVLTVFCFFLSCTGRTDNSKETVVPVWAHSVVKGSSASDFLSVTTDSFGNVYAAGQISGNGVCDFGNGVIARGSSTSDNALLVKFKADGTAEWARAMVAGSGKSVFHGLTVNSQGDIYAIGSVQGEDTYDFGMGITIRGSSPNENAVIVRYEASGVPKWAACPKSGQYGSYCTGIALDQVGSIYITGVIGGKDTLHGTAILSKYSPTGMAQWARTVAASDASRSAYQNVVCDKSDGVFVVGFVHGFETYAFGNGVVASGQSMPSTAVLVKYNLSGVAQWAQTESSSIYLKAAVDGDGNVYAAGAVGNSSSSKEKKVKSVVKNLLAKYNSAGKLEWTKAAVSAASWAGGAFGAVGTDNAGNAYAAGSILSFSTLDFGNGITARGPYRHFPGNNAVIAKFSPHGRAQWVWTYAKAPSNSFFNAICVDSFGNLITAGIIEGSGTFHLTNDLAVRGSYSVTPSFFSRFIGFREDGMNAVVVKFHIQ